MEETRAENMVYNTDITYTLEQQLASIKQEHALCTIPDNFKQRITDLEHENTKLQAELRVARMGLQKVRLSDRLDRSKDLQKIKSLVEELEHAIDAKDATADTAAPSEALVDEQTTRLEVAIQGTEYDVEEAVQTSAKADELMMVDLNGMRKSAIEIDSTWSSIVSATINSRPIPLELASFLLTDRKVVFCSEKVLQPRDIRVVLSPSGLLSTNTCPEIYDLELFFRAMTRSKPEDNDEIEVMRWFDQSLLPSLDVQPLDEVIPTNLLTGLQMLLNMCRDATSNLAMCVALTDLAQMVSSYKVLDDQMWYLTVGKLANRVLGRADNDILVRASMAKLLLTVNGLDGDGRTLVQQHIPQLRHNPGDDILNSQTSIGDIIALMPPNKATHAISPDARLLILRGQDSKSHILYKSNDNIWKCPSEHIKLIGSSTSALTNYIQLHHPIVLVLRDSDIGLAEMRAFLDSEPSWGIIRQQTAFSGTSVLIQFEWRAQNANSNTSRYHNCPYCS